MRRLWVFLLVLGAAMPGRSEALPFPSPLEGPGAPTLKRSQEKKIQKAWQRLQAGRTRDAAKVARKVADTPSGALLSLQIQLVEGQEPEIERLSALCEANPEYAAAWATLAAALEADGDQAAALAAGRKVVELWPWSSWAKRYPELEQRWVENRVAEASSRLENGDAEAALELADQALALDPASADGLLIKAEALDLLDRHQEAREVLHPIMHAPDAHMLMARMAEEEGDLLQAMQQYSALPEGTPGRDRALRRVKLEWRRQNLPTHVQQALASEALTRAELAVVLVGLVPEANAVGGGHVPLISDIVDLPSQREVVTVVRLGLMPIDNLDHEFHPDRLADPGEARSAVDRLCRLLDIDSPRWCNDGSFEDDACARLNNPMTGNGLAEVLLQLTHGESP
jgi:tetratricopeptide (TPR) repeat protein